MVLVATVVVLGIMVEIAVLVMATAGPVGCWFEDCGNCGKGAGDGLGLKG